MMNRSPRPSTLDFGGSVLALAIAVAALLLGALNGRRPLLTGPEPGSPGTYSDQGQPYPWISVYFTVPQGSGSQSLRGGPDEALAQAIHDARLAVDLAVYDLDLWSLRDALLAAQERGVALRVVAESDNLDAPELQALLDGGIPVIGDRREGLMHNKFIIIDRAEVWMGSMNFTVNGAYRNDNNLLRLRSPELVQNYLVEFEEMFLSDSFGHEPAENTPFPTVEIDGVRVETLFSPDDGAAARIEELLRGAQESLRFMAFSFTADGIAAEMIARSRSGVEVAGVFDTGQVDSNRGTEYGHMRGAGLDVHLDGNERKMHHKVIIIDGEIVITGSYNFSASAERRNDENLLIFHDPEIAGVYLAEFERVYSQAQE